MINKYDNLFKESILNPENFWGDAAKDVKWFSPYKKVLDSSNPPFYRWFPEGKYRDFKAIEPLIMLDKLSDLRLLNSIKILKSRRVLKLNLFLHVLIKNHTLYTNEFISKIFF